MFRARPAALYERSEQVCMQHQPTARYKAGELHMRKSPRTNGIAAVVKAILQSSRANPILVGITIGSLAATAVWVGVAVFVAIRVLT